MKKQHVGKFACSLNSHGDFHFGLTDAASRGRIVKVMISPENLALAIAGRGDLPCVFEVHPGAVGRAGMKRIDRTIGIDFEIASGKASAFKFMKPENPERERLQDFFDSWALAAAVTKINVTEFGIVPDEDWHLADNGIGRKQDGGSWKVTLCRFEEIPNPPTEDNGPNQ